MAVDIEDYGDIINAELVVKRYPLQGNRWFAKFSGGELTEGIILTSKYGDGSSPTTAIRDYCRKISNKTIVFHAYGGSRRREYGVPRLKYEGDTNG